MQAALVDDGELESTGITCISRSSVLGCELSRLHDFLARDPSTQSYVAADMVHHWLQESDGAADELQELSASTAVTAALLTPSTIHQAMHSASADPSHLKSDILQENALQSSDSGPLSPVQSMLLLAHALAASGNMQHARICALQVVTAARATGRNASQGAVRSALALLKSVPVAATAALRNPPTLPSAHYVLRPVANGDAGNEGIPSATASIRAQVQACLATRVTDAHTPQPLRGASSTSAAPARELRASSSALAMQATPGTVKHPDAASFVFNPPSLPLQHRVHLGACHAISQLLRGGHFAAVLAWDAQQAASPTHIEPQWRWDLRAAAAVAAVWLGCSPGQAAALQAAGDAARCTGQQTALWASQQQLLVLVKLLALSRGGDAGPLSALSLPKMGVQGGCELQLQQWLPVTAAAACLQRALLSVVQPTGASPTSEALGVSLRATGGAVGGAILEASQALDQLAQGTLGLESVRGVLEKCLGQLHGVVAAAAPSGVLSAACDLLCDTTGLLLALQGGAAGGAGGNACRWLPVRALAGPEHAESHWSRVHTPACPEWVRALQAALE